MTLVSGDKVYADNRGGSLDRGRQTTVGLLTTVIFSVFSGYFFRGQLLVTPKCMTLNDLEWQFRVEICFRAALARSNRATFEK